MFKLINNEINQSVNQPVKKSIRSYQVSHFLSVPQIFNSLIELVSSCGNYNQYRRRFSDCSGFRFPILGVHLKDLIAVHVALTDWADREKTRVNLNKIHQLYSILQVLAHIQTNPPTIEANMDLLNLLTVSTITSHNGQYYNQPANSQYHNQPGHS